MRYVCFGIFSIEVIKTAVFCVAQKIHPDETYILFFSFIINRNGCNGSE